MPSLFGLGLEVRSSLDSNPPTADFHVSTHGTNFLWAVFAIETLSVLGMFALTYMRPRGTRFFHNIALIMLTTSTIAYFAMASDLGNTPINTEFREAGTRQIWYVRYIQWFINFPLLLVLLLFTTGLPLSDIFAACFFAWVVVIAGLVGALAANAYKWAFFTFGLVSLMWIWGVLFGHGARTIINAGARARMGYLGSTGWITLLLMLYPICWACSEGGNVISVTSEMVWYGVLDLLLTTFFVYPYVFSLRSADYDAFGLQSFKYSDTAVPPVYASGSSTAHTTSTHRAKEAEAGIAPTSNAPGVAQPVSQPINDGAV